jgi:hypothetical protein
LLKVGCIKPLALATISKCSLWPGLIQAAKRLALLVARQPIVGLGLEQFVCRARCVRVSQFKTKSGWLSKPPPPQPERELGPGVLLLPAKDAIQLCKAAKNMDFGRWGNPAQIQSRHWLAVAAISRRVSHTRRNLLYNFRSKRSNLKIFTFICLLKYYKV